MCKLRNLFRSKKRHIRDSDYGRRFGWFIERDGECIGELEYFRWDENLQFWHEYRVSWCRPDGDAASIEDWAESGIALRNRAFTNVVVREFLSSAGSEVGVVSLRNAYVPDE